MSEIGLNSSDFALTGKASGRLGDVRPTVKTNTSAASGATPQGEQISAAVEKPVKSDDLSIKALIDGNPLAKAGAALEKLIPDIETLPNTKLRIEQNDETGRFVYQSIDNESGEIVRQFPSEELLEFLAFYQDLKGKVVDDAV